MTLVAQTFRLISFNKELRYLDFSKHFLSSSIYTLRIAAIRHTGQRKWRNQNILYTENTSTLQFI